MSNSPLPQKLLWSVARILLVVMLGWGALILAGQARFMYFPQPYGAVELEDFRAVGGVQLEFETEDGKQTAFYLPPASARSSAFAAAPEKLWLGCAGNGSLALHLTSLASDLDQASGWLLVDFPGYGLSQGKPSPPGIRENVEAAFELLARKFGLSAEALAARTGIFGHSMGASAALMAAEKWPMRAAVLISPFTSMTDMVRRSIGPFALLNRHRFDNRRALAAVALRKTPVHIFHGERDTLVPVTMGRELAAAYPQTVVLHEISAAGHNDILDLAGARIAATMAQLTQPPR